MILDSNTGDGDSDKADSHNFGASYRVGDEGEFHSHSGNGTVVEDDGDLNWEDVLPHR